MGFANILPTGRFSAPKALKRAFRLAALAALALGFAPSRAAAQNSLTGCGTMNSAGTYTLSAGFTATASPCLTVTADNVSINLNGQTIDVSSFGNGGVAIDAGSQVGTSILGNGAVVLTGYTSASAGAAIKATGGSGLTITGVKIYNETTPTLVSSLTYLCENPSTGGTSVAQLQANGAGISISGVTGATISANEVCFYQYGISVQGSAIASNSSGSISGNTLNLDAYYMYQGTTETYSAGLVLSNSSGWTVSGNTVAFDGGVSVSGGCTSPTSTTGLNTCSFGLQVINGSSSNSITSNTVDSNFIGGIYAGPDTSGNSFLQNTALSNFYDVWDDAPSHANSWHRNTCSTAGGNLNSHMCHG